MYTVIGTAVAALIVQGFALLALRMRLRSQLRRTLAHHHYLLDIARTLPRGSRLDERADDGSVWHLTISDDRGPELGQGRRP